MSGIMKAGASRLLKFVCLTDGNVYERIDNGLNDKGEKTQSRMALERMLEKTKSVDGKDFKVFALAEEPERVFSAADPFDKKFLKDDQGEWKRPSDAWLKERKRRVGVRSESAERAKQQLKAMTVDRIVEGLATLADDRDARRRRPEPKEPPKPTGEGGAA